jgi:HSP20 family protein
MEYTKVPKEVSKMTLTRYKRRTDWDPFESFYDFPDVFSERMLDFPRFSGHNHPVAMPTTWHPSADVFEDGGNVYVKMDLPGMSKDDIDISFDGHILSITGRREETELKDTECYWSRERYYGEFHRYVHVPAEVSSEDLKAKYEDGVLMVTLHKEEKAKRKKIAIEAGKN